MLPSLILGIAVCACSAQSSLVVPSGPTQGVVEFRGGSNPVSEKLPVYVATTDAQKAQGLMGMRTLPQGIGMAFEWNQPTTGGFWMKDTLISLSVAFVDQHHRVVSIQRMTPCTADPCQVYVSPVPYELAVEANPNWFTARLIEVGEYAHLETGRAHA